MLRWWALSLVMGCGRLGFEPLGEPSDGSPAMLGTFATGSPIAPLASANADDDPTVTPDGLELMFSSNRSGGSDIYVSRRASRSDAWSPATLVTELSSNRIEKAPEYSADGLTVWFDLEGDIMFSTRATRSAPWSAPKVALDTTASFGTPTTCNNDLRMYLRVTDNGGADDLYTSARASAGTPWSTPTIIAELDQVADQSGPWVSSDCSRLYFDSQPASASSTIVMAIRDPDTGVFGAPALAFDPSIGSCHDPSFTADERYVVFSRRVGTLEQIWEATR